MIINQNLKIKYNHNKSKIIVQCKVIKNKLINKVLMILINKLWEKKNLKKKKNSLSNDDLSKNYYYNQDNLQGKLYIGGDE